METNFDYKNMLNKNKKEYIRLKDEQTQQSIILNNQNRLYKFIYFQI